MCRRALRRRLKAALGDEHVIRSPHDGARQNSAARPEDGPSSFQARRRGHRVQETDHDGPSSGSGPSPIPPGDPDAVGADAHRPLLRCALDHVARGWPVYLLVLTTSCPPSAIGSAAQKPTPTASASGDAWTAAPDNVGLACGRAGLVVVDLFCGRAIRASRGHFRSLRTRPVACWVVRWGR